MVSTIPCAWESNLESRCPVWEYKPVTGGLRSDTLLEEKKYIFKEARCSSCLNIKQYQSVSRSPHSILKLSIASPWKWSSPLFLLSFSRLPQKQPTLFSKKTTHQLPSSPNSISTLYVLQPIECLNTSSPGWLTYGSREGILPTALWNSLINPVRCLKVSSKRMQTTSTLVSTLRMPHQMDVRVSALKARPDSSVDLLSWMSPTCQQAVVPGQHCK